MSRSFLQQSNINLIPSSNLTGITWAPDGGGQFKTWKQVYSAIEKSITPVNIFLKGDPFTTQFIISDNVYNLNNSNFVGLTFATEPFKLKIQNATLVAVNRLLGNVRIEGYNSFGNVIECTQPDLCVFISELGSQVTNYGSSPLFTA